MLVLAVMLVSAKSIAVVPVAGVGMTSTELAALAPLDDAVRASVARDGVTLQSKEQTSAALSSARAAGVLCSLADDACWKKAAALCDVDVLLVPSAAPRQGGDVALVVTIVDVAHAAQRVAGVIARDQIAARTKELVDDAFARLAAATAPIDAPPIDAPPIDAPPIDAPPIDAPPIDDTTNASAPWGPGLLLGGAAGAGVVVGVIVAAVTSWIVIATPPRRPREAP